MNTLRRWATGRNILLLVALFFLINLVLIPAFYPKFPTLDVQPSYSPEQAYQTLSAAGEQGRQQYLAAELTLDLLYPVSLALMFSLAALYTFQRAFPQAAWMQKLALLPFVVMVVDYLENTCVTILLLSYPRALPSVAAASNLFTILKFALTPLDLLFVVGLVGWLVRVLRRGALLKQRSP